MSPDRFQAYDPQVQLDWTNKIISPVHVDKMWFIQFVPFVYPLMVPFALLPVKVANIVWCVLSALFGILSLSIILRERGWHWPAILVFAVAAVACYPSWHTAWWGQFAWFYVGFLTLFFLALVRKKDVAAGILLALMSIKPQYLPFFGLIPLAGKRWKLLAVSAITEAALFVLAGFSIGWQNVLDYPKVLTAAEKQGDLMQTGAPVMVSIRGPLSYFLSQEVVLVICAVALLIAIPLIYMIWKRSWHDSERLRWSMALTVVIALLLGPHTHVYDCTFLALAAALTLPSHKYTDVFGAKPIPYRIWSVCLYLYPIISWAMFLPLNDLDDRHYPKAYAAFNILLLVVGTIYFKKKSTKSDVNY